MNQLIILFLFLALATILGKVLKNTKFMRVIYPFRGWIISSFGVGLFFYNLTVFRNPFGMPFVLFPVLFVVLGLITVKKDLKI